MSNDLALRHEPITELFPRPKDPAEWERHLLSEEQLVQFKEQGFVNGIRLLSDKQIGVLRAELAEMLTTYPPATLYLYSNDFF